MASERVTAPAAPQSGRPLSPHLQIWGWTVTMAASITHRATGVALYAGTFLLAAWAFAVAAGKEAFAPIGGILASPFGLFILTGYAWALSYHLLGGLKYLWQDQGNDLDYETAKRNSWIVFVGSGVLALAVVAAGLAARGSA